MNDHPSQPPNAFVIVIGMAIAAALSLGMALRQAKAEDALQGRVAAVIDGDSLIIETAPGACGDDVRSGARTRALGCIEIRLAAIDAPEMGQTCARPAGTLFRCGLVARAATLRLAPIGEELTCSTDPADPRDRFGRTLGFCVNGSGIEINEALVLEGWALAFRRYLTGRASEARFIAAEEAARQARRGMHAGPFATPWDYRQNQRNSP